MRLIWIVSVFFFLFPPLAWAAVEPESTSPATPKPSLEVVSPHPGECVFYKFKEETSIYKDPSLFFKRLSPSGEGSDWNRLAEESPLLTTVKGKVALQVLDKPRRFRNFGSITQLYRLADPRLRFGSRTRASHPMVVPVQFCGDSAYRESLGFLLEEDLTAGLPRRRRVRLP